MHQPYIHITSAHTCTKAILHHLTDNGQNPEQWLCYTCYPNLPRVCVCFFPAKRTSVTELSHANKKICSADRKNVCKPRLHNDWRQPRAWAMDAFLTRGPHFPGWFLMFRPSNSLRMQVDDSKWHVCLHTVWTLFVQQRPRKPVCGQDARLVLAEFWVPLRVAAGAPEGAKPEVNFVSAASVHKCGYKTWTLCDTSIV